MTDADDTRAQLAAQGLRTAHPSEAGWYVTCMGMNNAANILTNAKNLGHQTHVAAFAIELVTGIRTRSVCCWCAESLEGEAHRLPAGGECDSCSYAGRDTLVVVA